LVTVAVFFALNTVAYFAFNSLGIERGGLRYVIGIGIMVALTSATWSWTAPKRRKQPQSN